MAPVAGGPEVLVQQLSGVDASFLYAETPSIFTHVSALILFDPHGGDGASLAGTKRLFAERLPLLDPMRRRLVTVPFDLDHPYWIEDPDLDLDFHIRETAVPPPGTDEQLAELVSRLIARPLDRSRPLWELYVINGLADGRIAQLTKVHHAAVDGVGGAQLLASIVGLEPDAPAPDMPDLPDPETEPSQERMFLRGLTAMATQPYTSGRIVVRNLREVRGIGSAVDWAGLAKRLPGPVAQILGQDARRVEDEAPPLSRTGGFTVPSTPFNAKVGPHRRFAFTSMPLERVKAVKSALGVTVNDVVLGMCSGALRTYLAERDALPDSSLRCMIPVSVRTDEQTNTYGNRVSGMFAALATDVDDPVERIRIIHTETLRAKQTMGALPADLLSDVAQVAPPAVTAQAARVIFRTTLATRIDPPFNLIISNVPGPQFPLYVGSAEMLTYIPVSAIADTQGLNITIMSYNGRCDFGLVACRDLVPDLWDLCHGLDDALDELEEVAGV